MPQQDVVSFFSQVFWFFVFYFFFYFIFLDKVVPLLGFSLKLRSKTLLKIRTFFYTICQEKANLVLKFNTVMYKFFYFFLFPIIAQLCVGLKFEVKAFLENCAKILLWYSAFFPIFYSSCFQGRNGLFPSPAFFKKREYTTHKSVSTGKASSKRKKSLSKKKRK